jgi:hypothetical protein
LTHFNPESLVPRLISKKKRLKYRKIILPAVSYGCETCSVALREEQKFRVLENRVKGKVKVVPVL